MSKKPVEDKRNFRRSASLLFDLKSLERTSKSSLEISLSMTSAVVEDLIQRLYREYPDELDQMILLKAQEILYIGREGF